MLLILEDNMEMRILRGNSAWKENRRIAARERNWGSVGQHIHSTNEETELQTGN